MQHLTPKQIVAELDKYIVGQNEAKHAVAVAIRNRWRQQQTEGVKESAEQQVEERILDHLLPASASDIPHDPEHDEKRSRTREKLREQLRTGVLDERMIELSIEQRSSVVGVLGQAGMEM